MKKFTLLVTSLLCSAFISMPSYAAKPAKANAQDLDKIIAIVNDDVVTRSELIHTMAALKMQMAQEQVPVPTDAVLQKQILDQLINKKLQLQVAKQVGIIISDADLDKAIQHIAEQNNMDIKTFYDRVNQEGIPTNDYRSEIHDQMVLQKIQQQQVVAHIVITKEEVNKFLKSNVWRRPQASAPSEYQVVDILVPVSETASAADKAAAQKRAEMAFNQLKKGETIQQINQADKLAGVQSEDLGFRRPEEMPSIFADAIINLKPKDFSKPIEAPNGYHILKIVAIKSAGVPEQVAPDFKQAENILMQRKFEEAVKVWVSKLRSQAFIVTNPI